MLKPLSSVVRRREESEQDPRYEQEIEQSKMSKKQAELINDSRQQMKYQSPVD